MSLLSPQAFSCKLRTFPPLLLLSVVLFDFILDAFYTNLHALKSLRSFDFSLIARLATSFTNRRSGAHSWWSPHPPIWKNWSDTNMQAISMHLAKEAWPRERSQLIEPWQMPSHNEAKTLKCDWGPWKTPGSECLAQRSLSHCNLMFCHPC